MDLLQEAATLSLEALAPEHPDTLLYATTLMEWLEEQENDSSSSDSTPIEDDELDSDA